MVVWRGIKIKFHKIGPLQNFQNGMDFSDQENVQGLEENIGRRNKERDEV